MTRTSRANYWIIWASDKESTFGATTSFHCRHQQWYDSWCYCLNRRPGLVHVKHETIILLQKQTIPNWSDFFSIIEEHLQQDISNVIYLPPINQAPTELSTIMEIIENTKKWKRSELRLAVDHAIHSELLEVLTLPANTVVRLVLNRRIVDFHTACVFILVIGKRFRDSGLYELFLFVEANAIVLNTVKRALHGKDYNHKIIALKLVFGAFTRAKADTFTNWV